MNKIDQDEITPSAEYIKNFNDGYFMAKYNPDFPQESIAKNNQSDRIKAFNLGMMQYDVEKKLEKSFSFLSKDWLDKEVDDNKKDGLDKDRNDLDIDR